MSTAADYREKIPNNVSLHEDRRLQRALESWQPNFLHWWQTMGPTLPTQDVYLRTAVNVGRDGWAQFGHVAMPEYRWGIFLAEADPERSVGFGDRIGEPVWNEVPGEFRSDGRRPDRIRAIGSSNRSSRGGRQGQGRGRGKCSTPRNGWSSR